MEDLVEEVVGEIHDETDRDAQSMIHEDDGAMLLHGAYPIHDVPDIGVAIEHREDGDYTTVAGLVLAPWAASRPHRAKPTVDGCGSAVAIPSGGGYGRRRIVG